MINGEQPSTENTRILEGEPVDTAIEPCRQPTEHGPRRTAPETLVIGRSAFHVTDRAADCYAAGRSLGCDAYHFNAPVSLACFSPPGKYLSVAAAMEATGRGMAVVRLRRSSIR